MRSKVRYIISIMVVLSLLLGLTNMMAVAEDKAKLKVWTYKQLSAEPWLNELVKRANKEFDDVEVTIDFKPMEKFHQLFRVAMTSKSGPDIVLTWGGESTLKDFARKGSFVRLNDYLSQEKFDSLRNMASTTIEGDVYGLNAWGRTAGLIYNKKIFEEAGLDPDSFPRTWNEFIDACEKIKATGKDVISYANKEGYLNEWWFNYLRPQSYDSPQELIDLNYTTYQEEGTYLALERYKELFEKGFFKRGGMSMPHALYYDQFLNEETAMQLMFLNAYRQAKENLGEDAVGLAPFPIFGSGKLADAVAIDTNAFVVTSWTSYPEKAVKVIDFWTNKENSKLVYDMMGEFPANKNVVPQPDDPAIAGMFDKLGNKSTIYAYEYLPGPVYDKMLRLVTVYLQGGMTAEQVTSEFDRAAKRWRDKNDLD